MLRRKFGGGLKYRINKTVQIESIKDLKGSMQIPELIEVRDGRKDFELFSKLRKILRKGHPRNGRDR